MGLDQRTTKKWSCWSSVGHPAPVHPQGPLLSLGNLSTESLEEGPPVCGSRRETGIEGSGNVP